MDLLREYIKQTIQEFLLEKKKKRDRCLRIADRKFDKPSAYKSSAAVRCRQGKIWKGVKEADDPQAGKAAPYGSGYSKLKDIIQELIRQDESLNKWFKDKWVRINTQGDITGACGTMKNKKVPSRCLPEKKARSMTKAKRKASAQKKKREGRKGKQFVKNPTTESILNRHQSAYSEYEKAQEDKKTAEQEMRQARQVWKADHTNDQLRFDYQDAIGRFKDAEKEVWMKQSMLPK